MEYNSKLIDSIKASFSSHSIENYYNDKISGKHTLPYTSIREYEGDDILRLELYFINYLENINTSSDFKEFVNLVRECFHNISVLHFSSYTFEIHYSSVNCIDRCKHSCFISSKLKYLGYFKQMSLVDNANFLNTWNNRLSYIYVILKHMGSFNFEEHCEHCRALSNLMETCYINRLLIFFSLVNKTRILESLLSSLFDQIACTYWNYELLLVSFSNSILKTLVSNYLFTYQSHRDRNIMAIGILHSFLECRNNYLDLQYPHAESFLRILGSFAMNVSLYYSNLVLLTNDENITFTNLFMSLILTHIVKACTARKTTNYLYSGQFGMKNQSQAELIYLKIFVESFIKAFADLLNRGGELALKISNINAFLDAETYSFLVNLKFKTYYDGAEELEYRVGVVLLYMIALHNQISNIRLVEVSYMRLIYSLPWSPAIQFCTTDEKLNYILPDFKKVVMESFGTEIYICNCVNYSIKYTMNDFTISFLSHHLKLKRHDSYYTQLFPFSTLMSNSLAMMDRKNINSHVFSFRAEVMYNTISKALLMNQSLFNRQGNAGEEVLFHLSNDMCAQKNKNISHKIELKWISDYLRVSYLYNKTICYLAVLDSLITCFIAENSAYTEKLTLNDIYLSTYDPGPSLNHQRELSSNFLSLNQNPLNLALRVPVNALVQLFKFRLFGNLLILLLSKLNKYIYEGISSFIASTSLQMDFFQLSALQSVSLINIITELFNKSDKDAVKQLRSTIFILLSMNPNAYEIILNSGLPSYPNTRFIHDLFGHELALKPLVDNYSGLLKVLQDSSEWDKAAISIKNGSANIGKSLEPLNKHDVALFHLYSIHLLALEAESSQEAGDVSRTGALIENVIKAFWDSTNYDPSVISSTVFSSSIAIIIKLHYLYPQFTKKYTETVSNLINREDITTEEKTILEDVGKMLKAIEYNDVMVTENEK
ncbi:hypothetical protein MACJ_001297 [Theileria orientalis]|uniref:Uncharacterized protein n=1 Tax=Theileria orientalis TaxID=68886 RepID=A0A976M879_THEOR|nr:hypothetical protein MACJ_001297 [Theileria orientalis]